MSGTLEILYNPKDEAIFLSRKWHVSDTGYAVWRGFVDGKKKTIRLHRLINKTPEGLETDHINGNKLDNRRENLRTVTRSQNMLNVGKVNVTYDKSRDRWLARIGSKHIGRFNNKQDAVNAYHFAKEQII